MLHFKVINEIIEEPLSLINEDKTNDKIIIETHIEAKKELLQKSTFALIFIDFKSQLNSVFQQITEALEFGTVPVFLCSMDCEIYKSYLPFEEVLDWSKFSMFLPIVRITEIHLLLRSFPDTDLFQMKKQGRQIWQNYLGSGPAILSTVLNLIRVRAGQ